MHTVSVTISKSENDEGQASENSQYELNDMEIIYDGLDRQGRKLPAGCLAGSCGTCRINVISGIENCTTASPVELDTLKHIEKEYKEKYGEDFLDGKHLRLACRTKITGAIHIEPFKS
jgi:ferredoxin